MLFLRCLHSPTCPHPQLKVLSRKSTHCRLSGTQCSPRGGRRRCYNLLVEMGKATHRRRSSRCRCWDIPCNPMDGRRRSSTLLHWAEVMAAMGQVSEWAGERVLGSDLVVLELNRRCDRVSSRT